MKISSMLVSAGAIGLVALSTAGAQITALGGSVVVTPYVGVYVPSADLVRFSTVAGGAPATLSMKQQAAPAAGATASYWFTNHLALEGGVAYSNSDLKQSVGGLNGLTPLSSKLTNTANVWLANAKVMLQLLPPTSAINLRLGVGPAVISRSGSAYREEVGKDVGLTDVGAAISLCTRLNVTPRLGIRLRGEDYIYQAKVGYENPANPSQNMNFGARTQHDLLFSAGLQLFLNR